MRRTPAAQQQEEGRRICVEIIQEVREIPGVDGVHIMAYRQEALIASIVADAGLASRPPRGRTSVIQQREAGPSASWPVISRSRYNWSASVLTEGQNDG